MKFICFCLFLFTGILYSQSFSSGDINAYINKKYEDIGLGGDEELQLNSDNTYEASYDSEGGWYYNKGSFEFKGGYIYLHPKVCKEVKSSKEKIPCSRTLGEVKIELSDTPNDIYFLQYLKITAATDSSYLAPGGDSFMGVTGMETPVGSFRTYKNIKVVTMGMQKGTTTSDVKIRETPDVNGKIIPFQPEMFSMEDLKAVPLGFSVRVIARTEEKVAVQKWNNYWYLVNVGFHEEVWMYGEFVKFD